MLKYLHAPYSFLLSYNSSQIVRNINNIVSNSLNGFVLASLNFMANTIVALIILSLIYYRYTRISLAISFVLVVTTILINIFMRKKAQALGKERDELLAEQNKNVYQGIHAIKETKVLGKEHFFMHSFRNINSTTINNTAKSMLLQRIPSHITEIVIIFTVLSICIIVLTEPNLSKGSSLATLGVLAFISFRIASTLNRILNNLQGMNKNKNSIEKMFSEIDKLDKLSEQIPKQKQTKIHFHKKITFEEVCFTYPKSKEKALSNINFEIDKGSFVAFVGESGAGKTTIADIILGLLSPQQGKILIDNADLNIKNKRSWQDLISFVPQEIYLSDDTICKNIAFGIENKKVNQQKIKKVLEDVKLWDFIKSKKESIHFCVGENGKNLSGGQKQRLAIARALYSEAPILILDEATSALDVTTENEISQILRKQRNKKTIITITHRLSTVFNADKIIYIEKGKILDHGTFQELKNKNKSFSKLTEIASLN